MISELIAECQCLPRQFGALGTFVERSGREVIDYTLRMRPCGERGGKCMVGIQISGALQQIERARVPRRIKRQDMRQGPQRQVMRP